MKKCLYCEAKKKINMYRKSSKFFMRCEFCSQKYNRFVNGINLSQQSHDINLSQKI